MPLKPESTHPHASAFPTGLSGPALRALARAGIRSMSELAAWSWTDLVTLHGMGPKTLQQLADAQHAIRARVGQELRPFLEQVSAASREGAVASITRPDQ